METKIQKLVGQKNEVFYVCEYIFKDSSSFQGVVATLLRPVSEAEYRARTDPNGDYCQDYFDELWKEAIETGRTEQSKQDFIEEILLMNGDEAVFDLGGYKYWDLIREAEPELTEENYPIFEYIGGGRSFSPELQFDKIYDNELGERIKKIER